MNSTLQGLGIIIIVLSFIYIILVLNTRNTESTLLTGFWRASSEFCQNADLDLFLVYLGECNSKISHVRPGYIIVKNADGLIINDPVEITLTGGLSPNPTISAGRSFNMSIDWLDENTDYSSFFPSEQSLNYYPDCGKLVLSDDTKVYAVLYKDHAISDITRVMPDHVLEDDGSI